MGRVDSCQNFTEHGNAKNWHAFARASAALCHRALGAKRRFGWQALSSGQPPEAGAATQPYSATGASAFSAPFMLPRSAAQWDAADRRRSTVELLRDAKSPSTPARRALAALSASTALSITPRNPISANSKVPSDETRENEEIEPMSRKRTSLGKPK
jgi:hypothetical protein